MDAATFRAVYPKFADLIAYPPAAVDFWIKDATARLDVNRWADQRDTGIMLFTAHKLTLAKMGAAGDSPGPVSSKSVGSVSVAYNSEIGTVEDAGSYNLTIYGREYWQLARLIGMGGIQL